MIEQNSNNSIIPNNYLGGEVRKTKKGYKKPSIWRIYWYLFLKVYSLVSILLITLVILLSSFLLPIIFFLLSANDNETIKNLQYFILIFYNIFLFIFILFISVRLFGNQVEENSFLLLLTKPYTRMKIIFVQYLVVFSATILIAAISCLLFYLMGLILITSMKLTILLFFSQMVLKFFIFLLLFSITLISSIVFVSSFLASKTVFLFFSIICSLFILGSLPYNLFYSKLNNTVLKFKVDPENNIIVNLPYNSIEKTIEFNKYLSQKKFQYNEISSSLYNFMINNYTYEELNSSNYINNIDKRIDFFANKLNIISNISKTKNIDLQVKYFKPANILPSPSSENIDITLQYNIIRPFKTADQIRDDISNNKATIFEKEILKMYEENMSKTKDFFIKLESSSKSLVLNNLLTFSSFKITHNDEIINNYQTIKEINNVIGNTYAGENDDSLKTENIYFAAQQDQKKFNSIFNNNSIYYLMLAFEETIHKQALDYLMIKDHPLVNIDDSIFSFKNNYLKFIREYSIINKINLFEHWNHLWTTFLGTYGNFGYNLITQKLANKLDSEKNELFSYPLFELKKINNHLSLINQKDIQNSTLVIISYLILSIFCFSSSLIIWKFKNIIV